MLINRQVALVAVEAAYGVDEVPTATDAVLFQNVTLGWEGLRMNDRPAVRNSIGTLQQIYGGALRSLQFEVEMKGSGTNDVPPEVGALLRACGFAETINGATSVEYDPASSGHDSVSIYLHQEEAATGVRHRLLGCRGNVSFTFEVGTYPVASFTMVGHLADQTDIANVTPTYDSTVPVPYIGGSFDIAGFGAVISSVSFDMGNTVATPPDVNAADGYSEIQITKRDVNGSFNPEAELLATENPYADLLAGTTLALDTGTIGATGGNIIQVTMPAVYYRSADQEDREGILSTALPFGAAETTGDNEVQITFT